MRIGVLGMMREGRDDVRTGGLSVEHGREDVEVLIRFLFSPEPPLMLMALLGFIERRWSSAMVS